VTAWHYNKRLLAVMAISELVAWYSGLGPTNFHCPALDLQHCNWTEGWPLMQVNRPL